MSHRFEFFEEQNLLVVIYTGEITPEEELQAVTDGMNDPRMKPNLKILADRTGATMKVGPGDIRPQIDQVTGYLQTLGSPKVAMVVSSDYDFGMARMFEMLSEDEIPHDLHVFRSVDEACAWLGVEPSLLRDV